MRGFIVNESKSLTLPLALKLSLILHTIFFIKEIKIFTVIPRVVCLCLFFKDFIQNLITCKENEHSTIQMIILEVNMLLNTWEETANTWIRICQKKGSVSETCYTDVLKTKYPQSYITLTRQELVSMTSDLRYLMHSKRSFIG